MDAGTILEVIRKLIGKTEPYGDSAIDRERAQNLDKLLDVIDELIYDVKRVAVNKDRHEESMRVMGKEAHDALIGWREWIDSYMEDESDG